MGKKQCADNLDEKSRDIPRDKFSIGGKFSRGPGG